MKQEALKRIDLLGLHPDVKRAFIEDGTLYYSEPIRFFNDRQATGVLYWLRNNPEWLETVRKTEEEKDFLVYHVIYNRTEFGELLTCLYISDQVDEGETVEDVWKEERKQMKPDDEGIIWADAYVINLSVPEFSEYGTVGIRESYGGLVRVG